MNILEKAVSFFTKSAEITNDGWKPLLTSGGYRPPWSINGFLKKNDSWIYANIKAISRSVSSVNFKLMKVSGDTVDEVAEHPFLELLYKPNPYMTKSKFVKIWAEYYKSVGEAPIRLRRKNPNNPNEIPFEMYPINPADLTVIIGKTQEGFETIVGYELNSDGRIYKLNAWEVIFINDPDLRNIWKGVGAIQAGIKTIDQLEYAENYNINFFKNSARPDAVLYTDQQLSDEARKRIGNSWRSAYGGTDKAHGTAILEAGLKLERYQNSAKDMDFVEQQKSMRDKLMSIFGTTKTIMGITEDVNRANADAAEYVYSKYTVKPMLDDLTDYLNEFLLVLFDKAGTMFLSYEDIVPENQEYKLNFFDKSINRWKTLNEVRAMNGDAPVDGGDELKEPVVAAPVEPNKSLYKNEIKKLKNRNLRRKMLIRELKKTIKSIVSSKKIKPTAKYKNAREKSTIDLYIKAVLTKEDQFEKSLEKVIKDIYEIQLKDMETKLGQKKVKGVSDYMFDKTTAVQAGIDLMTPEIEAIILAMGEEAFELLNIPRSYSMLESARRYLSQAPVKAVKSLTDTAYQRTREIVAEGLEEGTSIQEIARNIRKEYTDLKTSQAKTVARTETSRATGFAQVDAYKQSGVVQGKEWVVTDDDRLCEVCAAIPTLYRERTIQALDDPFFRNGEEIQMVDPLTGEKLYKKDGSPKVFVVDYGNIDAEPLHVNCRCVVVPVMEPIKSFEMDNILSELEKEMETNE